MGSANIMEPEIALKQIFGHERFRTELQEKAVLCALKGFSFNFISDNGLF